MDPQDVDSADYVRDGWDSWSYKERVEALDSLANATLDLYGYDDDVELDSGETDLDTGSYSDGEITIAPSVIENPDPEQAIHVTDHEIVHAMNDEDGIDDSSSLEDDDFDFTEEEAKGVSVRVDQPNRLFHSKMLIIDRDIVFIGSHNWSSGSYFSFDDLSVEVRSPEFARDARKRFEALWRGAERV